MPRARHVLIKRVHVRVRAESFLKEGYIIGFVAILSFRDARWILARGPVTPLLAYRSSGRLFTFLFFNVVLVSHCVYLFYSSNFSLYFIALFFPVAVFLDFITS